MKKIPLILIPKPIIQKPKIHGKVQAWLIDTHTKEYQLISNQDYFSYKKNLTPLAYLEDIAGLNDNESIDLEFKYVALSTAGAPPTESTGLELEKFREAYTTRTKIGNKIIVEGTFDETTATEATLIGTVTSKKIFEIDDRTGFAEGDSVLVGPEEEERIIDTLTPGSGTTAEIILNKDLKTLPVLGQDFLQQIGRIHLVYGASATATLNSGSGASIAQLKTVKLSTKILYTRHEIEYLGS
jgi:hypothetical protein